MDEIGAAAIGTLVAGIVGGMFAFLHQGSPVIPASRLSELREQANDLRAEIGNLHDLMTRQQSECKAEIARLTNRVMILESQLDIQIKESHKWEEQYFELRNEMRRRSKPDPHQ